MCVCVVVGELGVTVKYIKILNAANNAFYGKLVSPATMQIMRIIFFK